MDNENHKNTWNNFTKFVLWGTVAVVLVLVLMALFLLQSLNMKIASILEDQKIERRIAITPEIAKKSNSQAKEIDRLKRRISNLTATLRGQKTIEWISGKGSVRKVVFRDIKQKKLVKNENSRPKKFTALDAKVNKGPKARARPFYNAINNENDRMLRNKKELLQKDKSKRSEGSLSSGSVEFY